MLTIIFATRQRTLLVRALEIQYLHIKHNNHLFKHKLLVAIER